jgi:glucokinase
MTTHALLADVGGTNVRFALAALDAQPALALDSVRRYAVADFATPAEAAAHYLREVGADGGRLGIGVFAVAGRVAGDVARITNSPWVFERAAIAAALGLPRVRLVNDFAAQAMSTGLLGAGDVVAITGSPQAGDAPPLPPPLRSRTQAVIGPGTGLGVSTLIVRDGRAVALETEGGHVSFAPGDAEEVALLGQLTARFGRVSNERLVSGGGLLNLHAALAALAGRTSTLERPDAVTAGARAGDALCRAAVERFCAVFGAIAGDLVLTLGAWDGVFLTGGQVPRLLPELQASRFRARFEDKGRFAPAMARVAAYAVVHPEPGLLGAAAYAAADADADT